LILTSSAAQQGHKEYAMTKATTSTKKVPAPASLDAEVLQFRAEFEERSPLDGIVRRGAQEMLQAAIDTEVEQFLAEHASKTDEAGRRYVVRNGRLPAREIMTGAGALEIEQPRARDNDPDKSSRVRFAPSIIPQYMKKSPSLEELIPVLYLLGISTGDFSEALEALLGGRPEGFSANTVVRLKEKWTTEHEQWSQRSLGDKQYVYVWADGIHVNVRLEDPENKRQCILVLMGATKDGRKELIAVQDGYRESEQCWKELLVGLKRQGLEIEPALAIGDGALGFWAALRKVFPKSREQRCWVHKTANILSGIPKTTQPRVKKDLHAIWEAETKQEAEEAMELFKEKYEAKYPKAWDRLAKDQDVLLAFYNFPTKH